MVTMIDGNNDRVILLYSYVVVYLKKIYIFTRDYIFNKIVRFMIMVHMLIAKTIHLEILYVFTMFAFP